MKKSARKPRLVLQAKTRVLSSVFGVLLGTSAASGARSLSLDALLRRIQTVYSPPMRSKSWYLQGRSGAPLAYYDIACTLLRCFQLDCSVPLCVLKLYCLPIDTTQAVQVTFFTSTAP